MIPFWLAVFGESLRALTVAVGSAAATPANSTTPSRTHALHVFIIALRAPSAQGIPSVHHGNLLWIPPKMQTSTLTAAFSRPVGGPLP